MLKYSLGLDVSAKDIHCCISVIDDNQKVTIKGSYKISNSKPGYAALLVWLNKQWKDRSLPLVVTMEATGVYYENCALFLFLEGYNVSVVLPNRAKKYLQSLGLKSKTDKIDAQGLSRMGAEQCLDKWEPMGKFFYELRLLTRHHQQLQELKTSVNNQLHAVENGMYVVESLTQQLKATLASLDLQLKEVEKGVTTHLRSDQLVAEKVAKICTIKGIGQHTVAVMLAETNGFALFKNSRQLVSYAGYDVVQNQSGSHKGQTRISKKGNSHIRRALHMPSFTAITYKVKPLYDLFERTFAKHQRKMKSYVAVQKKLLVLIYTLWKNNESFNEGLLDIS